ncbi:hypothetical protein F5X99DRAFT_366963 [Biscogniauxia marginata]|nr:hypothetical protein F5X99DRAFT_366963 [Biscogniauxia marginata]
MIPHWGGARIPSRRIPLVPRSQQPQGASVLTNAYERSPVDCLEVKRVVAKATSFPPELVDIIMDFAEYWACSVSSIDYTQLRARRHTITGGRPSEDEMLLRTPPLGLTKWRPSSEELWRSQAAPRPLQEEYSQSRLKDFATGPKDTLEHPARRIVFDITSHDQGHGGVPEDRYTYHHSFTWFDAGLDRFDMKNECPQDCKDREDSESAGTPSDTPSDIPTCAIRPVWPPLKENAAGYHHELYSPADRVIQRNKLADGAWQHHHVEWSWSDDIDPESTAGQELDDAGRGTATGNGEFVRNLKLGDMITIWGRARFGAWANHIEALKVQVYWAV